MTSPSLENQVYTITDNTLSYQVPEFTSGLEWCTVTYSYNAELPEGSEDAVKFDAESRTFTVEYVNDLHLSGLVESSYVITITGTTGSQEVLTATSTFEITFKNPCIDPEFLTIQQ